MQLDINSITAVAVTRLIQIQIGGNIWIVA